MSDEPAVTGVRINGGKVHVRRPGLRPVARCGQSLRAYPGDTRVEIDSAAVPTTDRCRNCFPGSTRSHDLLDPTKKENR